MNHIKRANVQTHNYYDGAVEVTEFNFSDTDIMNDAEITIRNRYPVNGYAVNDISTALISIEAGSGTLTIKDSEPLRLEAGDRQIIKPGEPYFFIAMGELAIRYIATPAWAVEQSRVVPE